MHNKCAAARRAEKRAPFNRAHCRYAERCGFTLRCFVFAFCPASRGGAERSRKKLKGPYINQAPPKREGLNARVKGDGLRSQRYLREKGIEKKTESKRAWLGWFVFANLQFCAQSLPHILKMIIHRCLSFNSLCTINYETAQCCWQRSVTGYRFLADMRTNWQEEQKGDLYNRYIHVIMHCKMSVHIMAQY